MSLVPLFTYVRSFPAGILYGVHDFTEFPVATVYSRSQKIPIIEMRMAFVGWSRLLRSRVRRESTEKGDTRAVSRVVACAILSPHSLGAERAKSAQTLQGRTEQCTSEKNNGRSRSRSAIEQENGSRPRMSAKKIGSPGETALRNTTTRAWSTAKLVIR